jgi:glycosyltransferase involved in cell wall biosynthesis
MIDALILIKGLGRGGAEQLVLSAIRHGDRSRFRYRVAYLLPWKDALVGEIEGMGVPTYCLDGARGVGWIRRLRSLVRSQGIDVVHAHSPVAAAGARWAVGRMARFLYTEHNVWERYHAATYWANVLTFPRNDRVVAVSDEVRRSIRYPRGIGFLRMPPVETVHHGAEPAVLERPPSGDGVRAELGIPEDAPLVGTVANLKAHKGLDQLLEAAVEVRRRVPSARFVVVGQGPMETPLRAQAAATGLDGVVTFAGFRTDALRIAAAMDVFVLSSHHEGLSIALVEAMALGRPVVVTRVGGLPEVVDDGQEGLLVPPGDPAALAAGIAALLGDGDLRRRMGEAARRRARGLDVRHAVRRTEELYAELVADRPPIPAGRRG